LEEFFIYSLVSNKAKLPKILLGLLSLIGGSVLLYYWSTLPPSTVGNYYETEIVYSDIDYKRRSDYPKITIKTKDKDYELNYYIWRTAKVDPEAIVQELSKSSNAKIWLSERHGEDIRGIITPTLTIEPTVGVEWDNSNNGAMRWVAIMFIVCGLILVPLTLLFSS